MESLTSYKQLQGFKPLDVYNLSEYDFQRKKNLKFSIYFLLCLSFAIHTDVKPLQKGCYVPALSVQTEPGARMKLKEQYKAYESSQIAAMDFIVNYQKTGLNGTLPAYSFPLW